MIVQYIEELINSYFGIGSTYYHLLLHSNIRRETVACYLYMAVGIRDVKKFNPNLDRLCAYLEQLVLSPEDKHNTLRALKLINDLMFNHQVQTLDGVLPAREFYFARFPRLDVAEHTFGVLLPEYLIKFVNITIQMGLKLQAKFSQLCSYDLSDLSLEPSTSWRTELKLPALQSLPETSQRTVSLPGTRHVRFSEVASITLPRQSSTHSTGPSASSSTQSLPVIAQGRAQCTR